ncbi:MAG: hypothetical protein KZY61_09370 [Clostridiaceae bacterium]|nr:hypothetical protein [Clostridiaceae bacterium]MBW4858484.1 hypothetical protein [Clostridiaceae bacterium]MBW4868857.1 hypothetical protein [Clostridiaceae bacterium]
MKGKIKYRIYDRFIITDNVQRHDLILGDISPRIKSWKIKEIDELRMDFVVKRMQLIEVCRGGNGMQCVKNKPIKLFEEYVDKRGNIRLREVENSMTKEDGSYKFDVLVDERYFPKHYTVLIKM